jgi:hypothetical protein
MMDRTFEPATSRYNCRPLHRSMLSFIITSARSRNDLGIGIKVRNG